MTAAVSNVMSVVDTVITTVEGNATLFAFMVVGLIGAAIGIVKSLVGRF